MMTSVADTITMRERSPPQALRAAAQTPGWTFWVWTAGFVVRLRRRRRGRLTSPVEYLVTVAGATRRLEVGVRSTESSKPYTPTLVTYAGQAMRGKSSTAAASSDGNRCPYVSMVVVIDS
jgi:hypothetical protein